MTHTYLVEDFLCEDLVSLRIQILGRYPQFVRNLMNSPSAEVRFMINIVQNDVRSRTCENIKYLSNLINDNCLVMTTYKVKQMLPRKVTPPIELYRKSLLSFLLDVRIERPHLHLGLGKQYIEDLIYSLCAT